MPTYNKGNKKKEIDYKKKPGRIPDKDKNFIKFSEAIKNDDTLKKEQFRAIQNFSNQFFNKKLVQKNVQSTNKLQQIIPFDNQSILKKDQYIQRKLQYKRDNLIFENQIVFPQNILKSKIQYFIDEVMDHSDDNQQKKNFSSWIGGMLCSQRIINDKLDSQTDIFFCDQQVYNQNSQVQVKKFRQKSPQDFKSHIKIIIQWVCEELLFDPFEFVFWLNIVTKEEFDILMVRQSTGLDHFLFFEYLLLYIGLHLKSCFRMNAIKNYPKSQQENVPNSHFVDEMHQEWANNQIYHTIWQNRNLLSRFDFHLYNLSEVHSKYEYLNNQYNQYISISLMNQNEKMNQLKNENMHLRQQIQFINIQEVNKKQTENVQVLTRSKSKNLQDNQSSIKTSNLISSKEEAKLSLSKSNTSNSNNPMLMHKSGSSLKLTNPQLTFNPNQNKQQSKKQFNFDISKYNMFDSKDQKQGSDQISQQNSKSSQQMLQKSQSLQLLKNLENQKIPELQYVPSILPLDSQDCMLDGALRNCELSKNASFFLNNNQELPSFYKTISGLGTLEMNKNMSTIFNKIKNKNRKEEQQNIFKQTSIQTRQLNNNEFQFEDQQTSNMKNQISNAQPIRYENIFGKADQKQESETGKIKNGKNKMICVSNIDDESDDVLVPPTIPYEY